MNTVNQVKQINQLWEEFRSTIDAVDKLADSADGHAEVNALHDYTQDRDWQLASLLGRETANERQHRKGSEAPKAFGVGAAARLQIMTNAAYGASLPKMPSAHLFLTMRQTAIEAEVIGYLLRGHLSQEWRNAVDSIDYSKLMQVEYATIRRRVRVPC